jgi:hypothetical protein
MGERSGIQNRLPGAIGTHRVHRMCGISQQSHASAGPVRQWIAIAHGEHEAFRRSHDECFVIEERHSEMTDVSLQVGAISGS